MGEQKLQLHRLSFSMGGSPQLGLTQMKQIESNKDIFITSKRGSLCSKILCGTSQKKNKNNVLMLFRQALRCL